MSGRQMFKRNDSLTSHRMSCYASSQTQAALCSESEDALLEDAHRDDWPRGCCDASHRADDAACASSAPTPQAVLRHSHRAASGSSTTPSDSASFSRATIRRRSSPARIKPPCERSSPREDAEDALLEDAHVDEWATVGDDSESGLRTESNLDLFDGFLETVEEEGSHSMQSSSLNKSKSGSSLDKKSGSSLNKSISSSNRRTPKEDIDNDSIARDGFFHYSHEDCSDEFNFLSESTDYPLSGEAPSREDEHVIGSWDIDSPDICEGDGLLMLRQVSSDLYFASSGDDNEIYTVSEHMAGGPMSALRAFRCAAAAQVAMR